MKKLLLTLALCMGYLCTTVAQTFVKNRSEAVDAAGGRLADCSLQQGYLL